MVDYLRDADYDPRSPPGSEDSTPAVPPPPPRLPPDGSEALQEAIRNGEFGPLLALDRAVVASPLLGAHGVVQASLWWIPNFTRWAS